MRTSILSIAGIIALAADASAQAVGDSPVASIRESEAEFTLPRALLEPIEDSATYVLSWAEDYFPLLPGDLGVFVTVFGEAAKRPVRAAGYETRPAGSMNMVVPVPDSAVRAQDRGSLVLVTINSGFTLAELMRIRPDSIRLDRSKGIPGAPLAWIHPTYTP